MDCSRCGAPLSSRDLDCPFCGRGRDVSPAPAPAARAPAGSVGTVKTGFWIVDVGENKVSVISVLREHLGIGLREAKDLVESTPPIRVSTEGADGLAKVLEDLRNAGADARLLLLGR